MAKELKLNLPSVDDLFSTQEERDDVKREKVMDIPLSEIDSFPNHPFQVRMDAEMQAMTDSVKAVGIQTPDIVRQKEDAGSPCGRRYELISGHRRKMACELAGLEVMPCIVRQMSRDEAIIAMVDSNLQREVILPSEKAKSYKMKLDALKRQGQRTDLTSTPLAGKLKGKETAEIIGEAAGDSKDQVRRFIHLTDLIPEVLNMVDEGKIAMRPAVELSYLPKEQQQTLYTAIESEASTPSHVQAMKIRKFSEEGRLNEDVILLLDELMQPEYASLFAALLGVDVLGGANLTDIISGLPTGTMGADVIQAAAKKLGCPYVWGAKGPNKFDCSGFTYWAINGRHASLLQEAF